MQRAERHIKINDKNLDELCFLSKNLYNYCNYILRQVYINRHDNLDPEIINLIESFTIKKIKDNEEIEKIYYKIKEYKLTTHLAKTNQKDYRSLPAQTSQQIIKLLYKNWNSFFKSIKDYHVHPNECKGIPNLPKYKHKTGGRNVVIFTSQVLKINDGNINFPKMVNLKPLKTKVKNINQVRIIPQATCYVIEVVYTITPQELDFNNNNYLSIDLGLNNLATCVNNVGKTFIINGKIIKSINHFYNKIKSKLQKYVGDKGTSNKINRLTFKRNNQIQNYLHQTSRFIINYCIEHKIKNVVIGYNKNWKNKINIGKRNNQNFVNIPHAKLISMIKYKADEVGINVITHEESYTSKCDSLALEPIKKHEKYLGKRIKRGLFQSNTGKLINADVNGSINILRKVIQNEKIISDLLDRGFVLNPIRINLINKTIKNFNTFNSFDNMRNYNG
jgi:putative transposase